MLDIGMSEMVVIGVVALIVVGPKDLPQMFRKVGTFVGKARGMARDFQNAMHDAADGSGINEIKSSFDKATNLKDLGIDDITDGIDYTKDFHAPKASASADGAAKTAKSATKSTAKAAAKKAAPKTTAKKTPAKKPAATKTAAKKPAAKKPAAKKPAAKKAT